MKNSELYIQQQIQANIPKGASQCVNKAENLSVLGNREQGTGNRYEKNRE